MYFYTVFLIASTGVAALDSTLNTLKVVCAGVIALIGAIILLMGVYEPDAGSDTAGGSWSDHAVFRSYSSIVHIRDERGAK